MFLSEWRELRSAQKKLISARGSKLLKSCSSLFTKHRPGSDLKDSTKLQELQSEIHTTGMLLNIRYLFILCRECYVHDFTGLMWADGHCTWQASSCKIIQIHYNLCQIILFLESQEITREVSAHTHLHTQII